MATITTDDGVSLYCEDTGTGTPIVFVHEFAGDCRSWEPQVRYFSRRFRCITYNARGYAPSQVPDGVERYSQERVREDLRCVLEQLKLPPAHIVGLSMGAFATLHFGMRYCAQGSAPRALSLTLAGCGSGSHPAVFSQWQEEARGLADTIERHGMAHFAATYGHGAPRMTFRDKDPRGFEEFVRHLAEHSATGSAQTMHGYQARRPCLYHLTDQIARIDVPVLVMTGDEDEPCLEPSLMLKRAIPKAGLAVLPRSGHAINLEEPALFNELLGGLHRSRRGRTLAGAPRSGAAVNLGARRQALIAGGGEAFAHALKQTAIWSLACHRALRRIGACCHCIDRSPSRCRPRAGSPRPRSGCSRCCA